jgi:hypothetical protein
MFERSELLQTWVGQQRGAPSWAQSIAIIDAATTLADQPCEGEPHADREPGMRPSRDQLMALEQMTAHAQGLGLYDIEVVKAEDAKQMPTDEEINALVDHCEATDHYAVVLRLISASKLRVSPSFLQERERCAQLCEDLAHIMQRGAGEPEPGGRLRQAAQNIRRGELPGRYTKTKEPEACIEDDGDIGFDWADVQTGSMLSISISPSGRVCYAGRIRGPSPEFKLRKFSNTFFLEESNTEFPAELREALNTFCVSTTEAELWARIHLLEDKLKGPDGVPWPEAAMKERLERVSLTRQLKEYKDYLQDPEKVHVAMLGGQIAKPDFVSFLHLYGEDYVQRWRMLTENKLIEEAWLALDTAGQIGVLIDQLKDKVTKLYAQPSTDSTPVDPDKPVN